MTVFERAFATMRRRNRNHARTAPVTPTAEPEKIGEPLGLSDNLLVVPSSDGPGVDDFDQQQYLLHKEAAEAAAALDAPPVPPPSTSDEGVLYEWVSSFEIVNLSNDPIDSRRRELHVAGRAYHHVAETAGHWLYRRDA